MTETKKIWGNYYEMDTGDKINKIDMRIPPDNDIVSKCGNIKNQKACSFYKKSIHRSSCYYSRFKLICDRLIVKKEE